MGWNFEGMYRKLKHAEVKAYLENLCTYTSVGGTKVKPVKASKNARGWWVLLDLEGQLRLTLFLTSQREGEFGYKEVTDYIGAPIRMLENIRANDEKNGHLEDWERKELNRAINAHSFWNQVLKAGEIDCLVNDMPCKAKRSGSRWFIYGSNIDCILQIGNETIKRTVMNGYSDTNSEVVPKFYFQLG